MIFTQLYVWKGEQRGGWRDGSEIEGPECSSIDSHHPHSRSQVLGNPVPTSGPCEH